MTQQERNRDLVVETYRNFERGDRSQKNVSANLKACVAGQTLGREQWLGFGAMFMEAFPDGVHVWEHIDAVGDYVLLQGHFTGTHRGPFQGIAPTGRKVKFSATIVEKVVEGKLVEHRGDFDSASLMQQLAPDAEAKAFVENVLATVDRQDWAGVRALVAPSCKVHIGAMELDRDGWLGMGKQFYSGFPDGKHSITEWIASGDRVVAIGSFGGTHTGEFQGVPPTGKKVRFSLIQTYRVEAGLIVEHRGEFDAAGMMQQLAGRSS